MASGGGSTTQTTQPWYGQEAPLLQSYTMAQNYANQNPTNYVAPLSSQQNQAIQAMTNYGSAPSAYQTATENNLTNIENGQNLSASNPYFQNMMGQVAQTVTPEVQSQFEAAGRYGSGDDQAALSSALTNEAGNLAYQNYQQGLTQQLQGAALAPNLQGMDLSQINSLLQAGQITQAQAQNLLNAPLQQMSNYAGLVQGNTGTQTTTPYFTNPALGALGGAASGAMVGSEIYPGIGTAAGAAIGGLMGYLG